MSPLRLIAHRLHAMFFVHKFAPCPRCGWLFSSGLPKGMHWIGPGLMVGQPTCCPDVPPLTLDDKILLAIKRLTPNAYGVNVRDHLRAHDTHVSFARLYTHIEKLEAKVIITCRMVPGGPARGGRGKLLLTIKEHQHGTNNAHSSN
jgi:hypothetical protein